MQEKERMCDYVVQKEFEGQRLEMRASKITSRELGVADCNLDSSATVKLA